MKRYLEIFFDDSPSFFVMLDRNYDYIRVNKAYARVYDKRPDYFMDKNFMDYHRPEHKYILDCVIRTKKPQRVSDKPCRNEHLFGGAITYWDWTAVPVLDLQNQVEALILYIDDVTERNRAERALAEERLRLYSVLDAMPAIVYLQAPDYTINFANQYFRNCFGEPNGRYCYQILMGSREPCPMCPTFRVFKTGKLQDREWNYNERTYRLYNYPYSDIDNSPLVLVLGIDITEKKQFNNEMFRYEQLNLVGEMAAGIGHEVRNPMTTVRGFLQMLGGKTECVMYKDYFKLMIEELDRANSIITEFLSLAKNKPVDLTPGNLNDILKAMFPLVQADAMVADKNVLLETGDIATLLLDEKEIRQLVLNLTRNGLEVMPPGKLLTIATRLEDGEVILSIKDQGKGIAPELMEKLGTPFVTTKENGTGLGLAVCYSIASRHNAAIDIHTGPDGTTFNVKFRIPDKEPEIMR